MQEFSLDQIRDFNSKGYTSVAARMVSSLLGIYDKKQGESVQKGIIVLNDRTIKSLKQYLKRFPNDAKIVFIGEDSIERELVICCNAVFRINDSRL